jgi:hypothetical protein
MRHFKNKEFITELLIGLVLLLVSLIIQSYAVAYTDSHASNSVTDIVLSNTPVFNVYYIYVYGALLLVGVIATVCLNKPQSIPFVLKSIAIFTLVRAFCISLTHIGPFPSQTDISSGIFTSSLPSIFTGDDFFFSGHTGLPFLMALTFWEDWRLRLMFLAFSVFLATAVLLGHLHYSIDVVSAFFISFGVFCGAKVLFKRDWIRLEKNV